MKKKIVLKTLAIVALLVGAVLLFQAVQGILEGNKAYDLFRKIRVNMSDVYSEVDTKGLDQVKEDYRDAFAIVDKIDALGGTNAQRYLNDIGTVYGLVDTVEVTEALTGFVNNIEPSRAWQVMNEVYAEINKAAKAYAAVEAKGIGYENATSYVSSIESALKANEDTDAARDSAQAVYVDPDKEDKSDEEKEKDKIIKEFFDYVFGLVKSDGSEESMRYMNALLNSSDLTSLEFAQEQVNERHAQTESEDKEQIGQYINDIFRLCSDQGGNTAKAKSYLQGLLMVASVNSIGTDQARQVLDDINAEITEAEKAQKMVTSVGAENAEAFLAETEAALETESDPEAARALLEEKEAFTQDGKKAKTFLDYTFDIISRKEKDAALQYIKAVISDPDATAEEIARNVVTEKYAGVETGENNEALNFCRDVFYLISDQGIKQANDVSGKLLTTMAETEIKTARAYMYYVYEDKKENEDTRKAMDAIFRAADEKGMEYVHEHGDQIGMDMRRPETEAAQTFLKAVDDSLAAAGQSTGDPVAEVIRFAEAAEAAQQTIDVKDNTYLTELLKLVDDANKNATKKKPNEKKAQRNIDEINQVFQKVKADLQPEILARAEEFQHDVWKLMNEMGLERAKKYINYASDKAYSDKTLGVNGIDKLGTDNVKILESLNNDQIFRMRNKARLLIFAAACIILGIVLMLVKTGETVQPRLSRAERKEMGGHMGLKTSRMIANSSIHAVLILISVIWLIPFISIVMQSLRVESTLPVDYIMPEKVGLYNYQRLMDFETVKYFKWYSNTFIMALVVAVLQTVIVLCMSYALSRFRFKMRKALMRFMLILGMFPGMLAMIILYRVLSDLGLYKDRAVPGLILVYVASSGMGYYVSKGFFDTIPKSLDEAARVDGATRFQVLKKIILPLSKPIVIYTILTAFMGPWGDYVFASYISFGNQDGMNVAVGLYSWLTPDQIANKYTMFCAGGVLVAIPVAILFMCLQRYYVEGVTGGAVKG